MDRRSFLKRGAAGVAAGGFGMWFLDSVPPDAGPPHGFAVDRSYGSLLAADDNGIQLPAGFTSRVVAISGVVVAGTSHRWHRAPDGGACFPTPDRGWIYVSNSELTAGRGGAGALRFAPDGTITDAYRILSGTTRNCAGGPTPWGTWLSCEENGSAGRVWECDPLGTRRATVRPAMGAFNHEAAACDPIGRAVYLTEDATSGRLHRFRPTVWGDLSSGTLEAAVVIGSTVTWTPTIAAGSPFDGGEGAWYADDRVWFTTKGDNRLWELDVRADPNTIRVLSDRDASPGAPLGGVDNITGSASGDLFVAEDGDNMELVMVAPSGASTTFLRILDQEDSEITGPAFSPDGTRLYVSSQRGPSGSGAGITYEVWGPF